MVEVSNENYKQAKQFVINNLKRSGFIYGNLDLDQAVNYLKIVDGEIVAMTNIVNQKYCTYLFPVGSDERIIREVIEFMQDIPHTGGTVVGDYYSIWKDYYQLPDNAINEVATLAIKNNSFQSIQAEHLTNSDIDNYYQAISTITEFEPRSLQSVYEMFSCSQVVGIKKDGRIVSAATLSSLSSVNGVVTGVFTVKGEEGQGLAKDCVKRLLADYATNRTISIFFTNPKAKQLYLNLGFEVEEKLIMYKHK